MTFFNINKMRWNKIKDNEHIFNDKFYLFDVSLKSSQNNFLLKAIKIAIFLIFLKKTYY